MVEANPAFGAILGHDKKAESASMKGELLDTIKEREIAIWVALLQTIKKKANNL